MVDRKIDTFDDVLESLPIEPNARGSEFEKICKWFLSNSPEYKNLRNRVWLWDEWPDRPGPDIGIDIVAETPDGKLWAIQCKAYSSSSQINKSDIDSFSCIFTS